MKLIFSILAAALGLAAQTTGTVTVSSNITATAGTLTCTGAATVAAAVSTMHLKCMDGADVVFPDVDLTVKAPGSTTISIQRGSNTITWLLTKGNPTPDQWQVAANGTVKSGAF